MTLPASTSRHSLPHIAGYTIVEQLYLGSRTAVYRAVQTNPQRPVVIKVLRREYPSFSELVQFRNQYTIAKNLPIPGIVQPLSLEPLENGYALIMEDWGGVALGKYVQQQSLDLMEVLAIALQLADILHHLCQHRVVHKDIKPANILIHPESKQVKLIDFSIASLLPKETQEIQSPNILEGTLAYLAPEQTGRMNRSIDYRTDFYGLGVTLYQLLTGTLPFASDDPLELLHCHIAKVPVPADRVNSAVPAMVAAIVAKLMAKNAEDRYQSAIGLKHDLQQCLTQWKESGAIAHFTLGQRDLSDRFLIPEKLYGRETEVATLLSAFERISGITSSNPKSELMLVAGFSGIGKTAVVNEVHKPIVRQRGYFIKGKFDQFNRNIPLSAFVQALRDLMGQLLSESDAQLTQWRTKILAVVGENGQVLIDVIPELEQIIGKQAIAPELSGSAAQNRFNLLFQKFIELFTTAEHPLVIFLDDLQWADSASLQLIQLLVNDKGYLLMVGAYRDNEVSPAHPFILTVEELKKAKAIVNTIILPPLAFPDTNHLIADTFNCSLERSQPLTELITRKTQGNPFFTIQFLKALHADGYITFNYEQHCWECDIAQVNALSLTDDVVEFMAQQLQKLPAATQQVLKLAACVGNQFDLATLAIVLEQLPTDTATALWKALQEGLILPTSQIYKFFQSEDTEPSDDQNTVNPAYRFLHDRVQQAAYSLIPENEKQTTHLKIGQLLQQNLSEVEKTEKLFDIVGHLNLGQNLITQEERSALAQLNLAAAQKAKNSTAYAAARFFVQTGLDLLVANCWQTQYELTLNLYATAAETAYLNGDFEGMEEMAAEVLRSAQTILDKVKIYEIQIAALTAQSRMLEAIALGEKALAQLGVEFSSEPDEALTGKALQTLAEQLEGKQLEELINLPAMNNSRTIAAMQLLANLIHVLYQGNPALLPLLGCTMVSLSLQFGNAAASTIGYATYGLVLANFFGEIEKGYSFGQVALSLIERLNVRSFKCQTLLSFGSSNQHHQESLRATIPTLKQGYLAGIEMGDFPYTGYCILNYFSNNLFAGVYLEDWEPEIENYCVILAAVKQDSPLAYLKMVQQTVQNLKEIVERPDLLIGTAYNETVAFPKHHQYNELTAIAYAYIYKLMLAYFFGNYNNALDYIAQANLYLMSVAGLVQIPVFHFYAGLTYLAQCSTLSEIEQAKTLALLEPHQTTLAQWAHHAPMNHGHKVDLIEAEKCRVLGKNYAAGDWYDRAIAGAKENGYIQEEALANELAAKFYLNWGKEKVAAGYMQEAYYCYAKWGSPAKVEDLETRYPQLLSPILLRPPMSEISPLATSVNTLVSLHQTVTSSSTSISNLLDLGTVLKAAQTLYSEIHLDKLLATLMQVIVENSGADKAALYLERDGELEVVVEYLDNAIECLSPKSIDECKHFPSAVIHYVARTLETVITDAKSHPNLASDRYFTQQVPQSLLCTPILNQGKLIGVLYLENSLTKGAFTSDRVELLKFLCSQAAISLKNARLYQQARTYAQQLEQSQLQIIQSEKMASLGNLVAGVAHEMNNPIGFLNGSLINATDYVQDLLKHLALYQQHHPNPAVPVQDHAQDIDLEFLSEDLPKLLNSMQGAIERIRSISTSLRIFSRADTEHKISANLHEGIDSALLILKYRLKANEYRPAIQVIQDYGELPPIECFPGQLNQALMNILANAIDVFDEAAQHSSFADFKAKSQKIAIQTAILTAQNQVEIRIRDNGKGMTEDVKARIFDHLFTTKAVGRGTGLGLAIARQIVVEKHGGSLEVQSEVGQGTEFSIRLPIQG